MPTKKTPKASALIQSLHKNIGSLKQKLLKAHESQTSKCEKAVINHNTKIKKLNTKLTSLKNKKTPSAIKQAANTKVMLVELKKQRQQLKKELAIAKHALAKAKALAAVEAQAIRLASHPSKSKKKKVIKKKAVKKSIKSISDNAALTPDLNQPVAPSTRDSRTHKKTKKAWIPAKTKKDTSRKTEKVIKQPATEATSDPENTKENKPNVKTESPETTRNEVNDLLASENHEGAANTSPENKAEQKELEEKQEEEQKERTSITNWHSMPIVRRED